MTNKIKENLTQNLTEVDHSQIKLQIDNFILNPLDTSTRDLLVSAIKYMVFEKPVSVYKVTHTIIKDTLQQANLSLGFLHEFDEVVKHEYANNLLGTLWSDDTI